MQLKGLSNRSFYNYYPNTQFWTHFFLILRDNYMKYFLAQITLWLKIVDHINIQDQINHMAILDQINHHTQIFIFVSKRRFLRIFAI